MKKISLLILLLTSNAVWASQKVWLTESGELFDPIDPQHRKHSYVELPLPPEGDGYRLRVYYANGELHIEGLSDDPEWETLHVRGDFTIWYANGNKKITGHYITIDTGSVDTPLKSAEHGVFNTYHPNGQLAFSREYHEGKLIDQPYEDFDEQGRRVRYKTAEIYQEYDQGLLIREEHYKDGVIHGYQRRFSGQGIKLQEYFYHEGVARGPQLRFHENGQLRSRYIASEHNGAPEGEEVQYRPDGSLERRIHRQLNDHGEKVEYRMEQFSPDGELSEYTQRRGSKTVSERYNKVGELVERRERNDQGRQGLQVHRSWGSTLETHYLNDLKHGVHRQVFDDGSRIEGQYTNDEKHGTWAEYTADGSKSETVYIAGVQQNSEHSVQSTPSGETQLDGLVDRITYQGREIATYAKGLRHGEYQLLTLDGKPLHTGHFINGEPEGVHYFFAENGRMHTRESYRHGLPHGEWLMTDYGGAVISKITYDNGRIVDEEILESPH